MSHVQYRYHVKYNTSTTIDCRCAGQPIKKKFGRKYFRGIITDNKEVDDYGKQLYHIKYDDGDEEDLYHEECVGLIVSD